MHRYSMWATRLTLAVALLVTARPVAAQGFVLIANAAGPSSMSKAEVSRIFLKKGGQLVAVDQDKDANVRNAFSKAVLGRPVAAVLSYWQQQIFSGGEAPPAERASDAEVLAYVRGNPRAIGYVSAGADLPAGVQAVTLQ
jgi:ABC-type phosphate transport system substrate-binding protein